MDVRLSPDQEEFIRRAVEKGRYGKAEDVVREALAMLQERERKRLMPAAERGDQPKPDTSKPDTSSASAIH